MRLSKTGYMLDNSKTTQMLLKLPLLTSRRFTVALLAFALVFSASSCKWFDKKEQLSFQAAKEKNEKNGWINWNILFPANTNAGQRNSRILAIESEIRQQLNDTIAARGIFGEVTFKVDSCICDTLLYLLNADIKLWGTTGSNTTDPKPKDPGASGGPGELVDDNDAISLPDNLEIILDTTKKENRPGRKNDRLRLAVLDTGIDPTLFQSGMIQQLFWRDPASSINNFLLGANPHQFQDDNRGRHGSAVTALALRQFDSENYPALMILKVLNENGIGSVFTVSCALSYTAQNRAHVVNTSLGYFGKSDEILKHYVKKNTDTGNYVVAAAGNVSGIHNKTNLCPAALNPAGQIDKNLFFPACFSVNGEPKNLVTVTGISSLTTACFYQNYSPSHITLGVLNSQNCCFYNLPFLLGIEGSSFATPIVAGKIGNFLMNTQANFLDVYAGINARTGASNLTFGGRFVKE